MVHPSTAITCQGHRCQQISTWSCWRDKNLVHWMMHQRPIWWKKKDRCTLFNDCRRHVKRPQLDGKQLIAILRKKYCTCSDQNPPKQSSETRNRLKDDDPFPWRNAFWGALFTMAQAALACQIAPALDTDEDSSSLHFRAWHKGSSESHRRESSKIGPSKKLHRWLRKNIAWNCLEMSLVNIKKKLRGFASSLQLGAPGKVLEKGESPPNEDSMDFLSLILMVLQSCWLN